MASLIIVATGLIGELIGLTQTTASLTIIICDTHNGVTPIDTNTLFWGDVDRKDLRCLK